MQNSNMGIPSAVYIVGNSRSGTTMLARILNSNRLVFAFGELHFFEQLWSPVEMNKNLSFEEAFRLSSTLISIQRDGFFADHGGKKYHDDSVALLSSISPEQFTAINIYKQFLIREARNFGKIIPCEQTPRNLFYLHEILGLFPDARIINMVRDPRDILLSQKNKWKRRYLGGRTIPVFEALRSFINYHPITISQLWNASIFAAEKYSTDKRIMTVRYEDIVDDADGVINEVCKFLNISFDEKMLDVLQVGSSHSCDSASKGISRERAGVWRKGGIKKAELFICQIVSGKPMSKYGYKLENIFPGPFLLMYIFTFPLSISLALLMNLKRMKSILESIKRRWRQ